MSGCSLRYVARYPRARSNERCSCHRPHDRPVSPGMPEGAVLTPHEARPAGCRYPGPALPVPVSSSTAHGPRGGSLWGPMQLSSTLALLPRRTRRPLPIGMPGRSDTMVRWAALFGTSVVLAAGLVAYFDWQSSRVPGSPRSAYCIANLEDVSGVLRIVPDTPSSAGWIDYKYNWSAWSPTPFFSCRHDEQRHLRVAIRFPNRSVVGEELESWRPQVAQYFAGHRLDPAIAQTILLPNFSGTVRDWWWLLANVALVTLIVGLAPGAFGLFVLCRRMRRKAAGACPSCGYSLKEASLTACPECGLAQAGGSISGRKANSRCS